MAKISLSYASTGTLFAIGVLAGCATTGTSTTGKVHQFAPAPQAQVAAAEALPPMERSVTDLLRDADRAFAAANDAQQQGDSAGAMRQYTLMLELLVEAKLDPSIFYSLRQEFTDILDTTSKQASLAEKYRPQMLPEGDTNPVNAQGGLLVPFPLPERVLAEIEEIQQVYPKNFQWGLDRSHKYMPFIQEELKKAGLPQELAYIVMVESQFTPRIVSRAGAGGMWQFMKPTGQRYSLRVDQYVDERYNWQSSTRAAVAYIKDLHDFFDGNWPLAIAAYNMGENGLERAIAANGGERNFWKLIEKPPAANTIPMETKKYYPKFLASMIIASDPARYGFEVNNTGPDDSVRVPVEGMYTLGDLDRALDLPRGTLAKMNPDLLNEVTPPSGSYAIAVPAGNQEKLAMALKSVQQADPRSVKVPQETVVTPPGKRQTAPEKREVLAHKVRRGDTISGIANKYGVDAKELMAANKIKSARGLHVGRTLQIHKAVSDSGRGGAEEAVVAKEKEEKAAPQLARSTAPEKAAATKQYTIKRGDTLFEIAQKNNVTVSELQLWNDLGSKSRLDVGAKLKIRAGGEVVQAQAEEEAAPVKVEEKVAKAETSREHKVRAGEYPGKIAKLYGVSTDDLLKWNNLGKSAQLKIGDTLTVKGGMAASSEAEAEPMKPKEQLASVKTEEKASPAKASKPSGAKASEHVVAKGDSPSKIAGRYGVSLKEFLAWNNMTEKSVLHIGQKCVVYAKDGGRMQTAKADTASPAAKSATNPPAKKGKSITHLVEKGHNPTTIASKYKVKTSDLLQWNGWDSKHVLQVGDKVVVYAQ